VIGGADGFHPRCGIWPLGDISAIDERKEIVEVGNIMTILVGLLYTRMKSVNLGKIKVQCSPRLRKSPIIYTN
jgi:hypothetical protein